MITVNTYEAKTRLSALLAAVERGEWVRICRNGRAVADLRPVVSGHNPLERDPALGGIRFLEDPTAPLKAEDWPDPE